MPEAVETLERLMHGDSLGESEAGELLRRLTDPELDPAVAGALLAALRAKGETAQELRGFARAMRALALKPVLPETAPALDVVGTGGDGSGSLNLSTGTALLAAACGVPVVKHGNRSISSRSGSADLLEALGLELPLDGHAAGECLARTGFTFLFAPYFHPSIKALAPVRRALGVRTVFNLLGPLTNPAEPPFQLIGAFSPAAARMLAESLAGMQIERAFVVHGAPGWDEPTPVGPFELFDVRPGAIVRRMEDPWDYGIPRCSPEDLAGADASYNAAALREVLAGRPGAHRDALVLGTALALRLTGLAAGTREAVRRVETAIDGGDAASLLDRLSDFSSPSAGGARRQHG